ncbi:MAG: LytTR family DNA-binding domain-containing protein [Bacteroidota bacterium]
MKVVIIEDENPAAQKLIRYVKKYDATIEVLTCLNTVETAVSWLRQNLEHVDLLFVDVQLHDSLSFSIFQQVQIDKPVIFTTAYDEYAIDAFKVNSVDYLLKPITFTHLSQALDKYQRLHQAGQMKLSAPLEIDQLTKNTEAYKERFLVRRGNKIQSVRITDVSYFSADGRLVSLHQLDGRKFALDFTLTELQGLLNPSQFFRANRSHILQINAIKDVVVYSSSRLKVTLQGQAADTEIVVSRDKVSNFKVWLAGE